MSYKHLMEKSWLWASVSIVIHMYLDMPLTGTLEALSIELQ